MVSKRIKTKFNSLMAVLLLISVTIIPLSYFFSFHNAHPTNSVAMVQSPCHKSAQSTTTKSCSSPQFQFNVILPEILKTGMTQSEKFIFLFILGLLAISPFQRIFKPPRLQFARINP